MALNIKPLSDRVLVEPAAAETTTAAAVSYTHLTLPTKRIV